MKKLAIFFIVLIGLVVIVGCSTSKKTVTNFSTKKEDNGTTTTVTTLKKEDKTEPTPIAISTNNTTATSSTTGTTDTTKFAITSLTQDTLATNKGYHLIQGTTPKTTSKITVNGYALSKYKAGETKWSYIAATSLGTLKKGTNYYTVSALDSSGNKIVSKNFTIVYNGTGTGTLTSTGNNSLALLLALSILVPLVFIYFRRPTFSKVPTNK